MRSHHPSRRDFVRVSTLAVTSLEVLLSGCGDDPIVPPLVPPPLPPPLKVNISPDGETTLGEKLFGGSPADITYSINVEEGTVESVE